jgi:hypothetical protein
LENVCREKTYGKQRGLATVNAKSDEEDRTRRQEGTKERPQGSGVSVNAKKEIVQRCRVDHGEPMGENTFPGWELPLEDVVGDSCIVHIITSENSWFGPQIEDNV